MDYKGQCRPQFRRVANAFLALFDNPRQRGAALCVRLDGETVIDIWAGTADKAGQQPWEEDTILNVFSCTKPFAAVAMLQLVEEGRLDLDAPVARYWPEFAVNDKGSITVRQVLSHRPGLPAIRPVLPNEALYDWSRMTAALAEEWPWWKPGTAHGYAPLTYGWLTGELIRRIEGYQPGEAIIRRTATLLGIDFHIGLDDSQFHRVAHISRLAEFGDEASMRLMKAFNDPTSMTALAFVNPPSVVTSANHPQWRRIQQPAANGHGNARSLAGFYEGLSSGRLLNADSLKSLLEEHAHGVDKTLLTSTRLGLGVMLDQPDVANATFGLSPSAYGHPGAGGSLGFADPQYSLSFGFVTNTLGPYVLMDPRPQTLAKVLSECL